jgi:hypothetical protein
MPLLSMLKQLLGEVSTKAELRMSTWRSLREGVTIPINFVISNGYLTAA